MDYPWWIAGIVGGVALLGVVVVPLLWPRVRSWVKQRRAAMAEPVETTKSRLAAAIPLAAGAWVLSFDKLTANVLRSEYVDRFWEAAIWAVVIDYGLFVGWLALRKSIGRGWALAVVGAAATIWFQADITTPESWVPPLFLLLALWVLEAPVAATEGGLDHEARYHEQVKARIALQAQFDEATAELGHAQAQTEAARERQEEWRQEANEAKRRLKPIEEERNTLQIKVRQLEEALLAAEVDDDRSETPAPAPTSRTDSPAAPEAVPVISSGGEAKEKLLSAWQKEPGDEWTAAALADAAGVSRTSARRFLRDVVPSLNGRAQ